MGQPLLFLCIAAAVLVLAVVKTDAQQPLDVNPDEPLTLNVLRKGTGALVLLVFFWGPNRFFSLLHRTREVPRERHQGAGAQLPVAQSTLHVRKRHLRGGLHGANRLRVAGDHHRHHHPA